MSKDGQAYTAVTVNKSRVCVRFIQKVLLVS